MQLFQGIGYYLKDDIEQMHQISARIESCVSQMKNNDQQALVHSRLEAIANIEERKNSSKAQNLKNHYRERRKQSKKAEGGEKWMAGASRYQYPRN